MQPQREGHTRLTREDGVVTVESDSLYVALTTLAQEVRDGQGFTINGRRTGAAWEVRAAVTDAHIPAQRQPYEACGCLTDDEGAHRGDCPAYLTRLNADGQRYWTRRVYPAVCMLPACGCDGKAHA